MKTNNDKTDAGLKNDILAELKYEPNVKFTDIGVLVNHGTVTLNGYATSYSEKSGAVRAAKRVGGVNAIADDIVVRLPDTVRNTDSDIAAAAAKRLEWSATIPTGSVQITVQDGWVTLEGEEEWWFQKKDAEDAIEHLLGVKGVSNLISIKPKLAAAEVEQAIKSAFKRSAVLEANNIQVETSGNTVTLKGKVKTYAELEEAGRAAWSAPGVFSVDNQITVMWSWFAD